MIHACIWRGEVVATGGRVLVVGRGGSVMDLIAVYTVRCGIRNGKRVNFNIWKVNKSLNVIERERGQRTTNCQYVVRSLSSFLTVVSMRLIVQSIHEGSSNDPSESLSLLVESRSFLSAQESLAESFYFCWEETRSLTMMLLTMTLKMSIVNWRRLFL